MRSGELLCADADADSEHSEALSEDTTFPARALASLVASKVYYHLGNLDDALSLALGAGKLFDVGQTGERSAGEAEYIDTVIGGSHCANELTRLRFSNDTISRSQPRQSTATSPHAKPSPRLRVHNKSTRG